MSMKQSVVISGIAGWMVLMLSVSAHAENHALVMGISSYPSAPLPGVAKDIESGRQLARLIGVSDQNIVVKKDAELSSAHLPEVIKSFSQRIKPGDRVFVYYSGHGTSRTKAGGRAGQCEKGLVTHDEQVLVKDDFHKLLNEMAAKTDKTFVFLDSCFSGGLVQATHSKSMSRGMKEMPRPKFTSSSPEDPCAKGTNYTSRDFGMESAARTPNYYLLAAASETEYAIDGGMRVGGYATTAILNCLMDTKRADSNTDGTVTLDEARQCAQVWIDQKLQEGRQTMPEFPYSSMTLTHGYGQGGNPAVVFSSGEHVINSAVFAQTLYEGRDATRNVSLKADKNPVKIGDYLNLELVSDRSGYVTVMVVGSSGKIYQIFPNEIDDDARITAGQPTPIPRPDKWKMPANPPAGDNWFLALVSEVPNRFQGLGEPAGIFKAMGNSGNSAKNILDRIIKPKSDCANNARDFTTEAINPCSTGYGAALIKITEME